MVKAVTITRLLASLTLLLAACKPSQPSSADPQPTADPSSKPAAEAPPQVTVELSVVVDAQRERLAARLGPDSPLAQAEVLVAVHHHIKEGWHIYWQNPGEAGLRTSIEIETEHAQAGAVSYPAPERFMSEGGQVSYGWGHEAVLFIPLTEITQGARVKIHSRYLACAESCIPGESELASTVAALAQRDDAATVEMLERIPEPAGERVGASWADGALHLRPTVDAMRLVELFPHASDSAILGRQDGSPNDDGGLVLHYRFTGAPPDHGQGVLRATIDGQPRWLELDLPWPRS